MFATITRDVAKFEALGQELTWEVNGFSTGVRLTRGLMDRYIRVNRDGKGDYLLVDLADAVEDDGAIVYLSGDVDPVAHLWITREGAQVMPYGGDLHHFSTMENALVELAFHFAS